jgi:hypothetical protein
VDIRIVITIEVYSANDIATAINSPCGGAEVAWGTESRSEMPAICRWVVNLHLLVRRVATARRVVIAALDP